MTGERWIPTGDRRDAFIAFLDDGGWTEARSAAKAFDLSTGTYLSWRKRYPSFKARVDMTVDANRRKGRKRGAPPKHWDPDLPLSAKRELLFGFRSYWHHHRIQDAILSAPAGGITLILVPPEHGKTSVLSDFITLRLGEDPNLRVAYVSEGTGLARKAIGKQKRRLEPSGAARFPLLHDTFGPFADPSGSRPWTADYFTVVKSDHDEQDYSMEARGWNSTIAGSRVDLMVIDDIQSHRSLSQTSAMLERVRQDFLSRVGKSGQIIVIGTRVGEGDIYERMISEGLVDELVALPATDGTVVERCELDVLADAWAAHDDGWRRRVRAAGEYARDGRRMAPDMEEFWDDLPEEVRWGATQLEKNRPPTGCGAPDLIHEKPLCPEMWPPHALARKRRQVGEPAWWRNFQQKPRSARDATFTEALVEGARVHTETLASFRDTLPGWRRFAALDPAVTGGNCLIGLRANTAALQVLGVSRNFHMARSEAIIADIAAHHRLWRFTDLVVETNAYQKALAGDQRLIDLARNLGFRIHPHATGVNKLDETLGVAQMAGSFVAGEVMWPWGDQAAQSNLGVLEGELLAWRADVPTRRLRQDCVMALWFGWLFWARQREGWGRPAGPIRRAGSPFAAPTSIPWRTGRPASLSGAA